MKSWIPAVCMLILGIAVGFLIASRRPREIPMAFSNVGSLYVNPKSGDVIKWYNGSLPQNVQFKYDTSPCVELSASDKCTIKATKGDYFYKCVGAPDTCPDPGIRVGSAVMAEGQTTPSGTLPGPYADPKDPKLWCASGTAKGQPIAAKAGQSFEFDPVGDIEFTVTFAANTCSHGDSLTNNAPDCTITQAATFPQTYKIHIDGGCTDGTGSLTLNPNP